MVRVLYLGTLREERNSGAILDELTAHKVPQKGTLIFKHKFVFGEIIAPGGPQGKDLVLVIGPVWGDYYHRSLFAMYPTVVPMGGGFITFTGTVCDRGVSWSALFYGSSGDFGVFDPRVLIPENAQSVADALRMRVEFNYINNHCPMKK